MRMAWAWVFVVAVAGSGSATALAQDAPATSGEAEKADAGVTAGYDPDIGDSIPPPEIVDVFPFQHAANLAVEKKLLERKVSLNFVDKPVMDALDHLQTLSGVNIVPDRSKFTDPDQTVTLKLTDVNMAAVLDILTGQIGLDWVVRDGVVFISDEDGVRMPPVTAVYDVKDLLTPREGLPLMGEKDQSAKGALHELIEIVKANAEPGSWDKEDGNTIKGSTMSGVLVITHRPDVHRRVLELFDRIRRARGILLQTESFVVSELVVERGERPDSRAVRERMRDLASLITQVIEPGTWDVRTDSGESGGRAFAPIHPRTIKVNGTTLVVTHTKATLEQVRKLLDALQAQKGKKPTASGDERKP